jgi:ParB family chromosome partitioning protein
MVKDIKELKISLECIEGILLGEKTFEIRLNDGNYQVGDILVLREYEGEYTGRVAIVEVRYVLTEFEGLVPGFCVLSIQLIWGGFSH